MPRGYSCELAEQPESLLPYGDISGIGVVTGFLGTAWLAVLLIVLHYLIAFDPNEDPLQKFPVKNQATKRTWTPNPIDLIVTDSLRTNFRRFSKTRVVKFLQSKVSIGQLDIPKSMWQDTFIKSILGLCDAQLLAGLGILVSGFADLRAGLSAYHFQVVTELAWFSNLTHVAGLIVLRRYLHESPVEKLWRLLLITVFTVMLVVALVPTVFFNWSNQHEFSAANATSYAICFYDIRRAHNWYIAGSCRQDLVDGGKHDHDNPITKCHTESSVADTSALQSTIISIIILVLTFLSRLAKLLAPLTSLAKGARSFFSNFYILYIRKLGDPFSSRLGPTAHLSSRYYIMWSRLTLLIWARLYTDIVTSTLFDVYWLLVSALWGTMRLEMTRRAATVDETDWSFGQILPVFLASPILNSLQLFVLGGLRISASAPPQPEIARLPFQPIREDGLLSIPSPTHPPSEPAQVPGQRFAPDSFHFALNEGRADRQRVSARIYSPWTNTAPTTPRNLYGYANKTAFNYCIFLLTAPTSLSRLIETFSHLSRPISAKKRRS